MIGRRLAVALLLFSLVLLASACQREEPPPVAAVQPQPSATVVEKPVAPTATATNLAAEPAPLLPTATATTPAKVEAGPVLFLGEGTALARGETLTDALPVWRQFAAQKPALLLLSNDPALLPPPEELRARIADLLANGTDGEIRKGGSAQQSAPLFMPVMSVDLALRQGWLRELVWVFPQRDLEEEIKLELFKEQLAANHLADAGEVSTLQQTGKVFSGRLRDMPFRAGVLPSLPELDGPLIVHIDLSYFQKLYKNEIATPVIPLVGGVLQQLKEKKLPVLAVTFSYHHAVGGIPLEVRFLGEFIGGLAERPERLDQPLPFRWAAQKDILYLENFFQKEEIRKLVERQAEETPKAAWVQFNRYRTATLFKEGKQALDHLADAVALDRAYALEYLNLASRAYDAKAPDQALHMLQSAGAAFPNDPFIKLQIAQLAMETGDQQTADKLVRDLRKLAWSTVYYPDMPEYLERLAAEIAKE